MTDIPLDRTPPRPLRLTLLMGMTALLFLSLMNRHVAAAVLMAQLR